MLAQDSTGSLILSTPPRHVGHSLLGSRTLPPACHCSAQHCSAQEPGCCFTKVGVLWSQLLPSAGRAFFEALLPSSVHNLNQCIAFPSLQASPIHLLLTDFQTAEMGTLGRYTIRRCVRQAAMVCEKWKNNFARHRRKRTVAFYLGLHGDLTNTQDTH